MHRHSSILATLVATLAVATSLYGQGPAPNRSIVVLKLGALPANVAAKHGVVPDHVYEHALNGFAAVVPPGILRKLQNDPNVAWIEPDQVYEASAKPTAKGGKQPPPQPDQTIPFGIDRIDASANPKFMASPVNVDVAVIDTGIDLSHPDLNVYKNVSFVRRVKTGNDDNGHGTHVAGTVAALNNGIGVVGVAPGARLWAVKVLDRNGSGYLSDVIKGVDYVTANSASIEVANMSLGGGNSLALNTAIADSVGQGVVYVVAAGNSADDASYYSPANSPDVLCVSAIVDTDGLCGGQGPATGYGADDTFATFSNYGSVVDIAAPGVDVLSTYKGQSYAVLSGTSMASPHVTGAVALYLASGDKPADEVDVALVRAAIIFAGFPQIGPCGFTGDPDGTAEPVLDASSL
ncbi:MAG: S8 family peptidase [Verrucomicrobia bacterium]|nr:S8 family peptidase [Verrucomicrobiota bacterium]